MREFKSINLSLLLSELQGSISEDVIMIASCNYGDHCSTQQVIPLTGVEIGYVRESAYSNSGFKIIENDDERQPDDQKVIILNPETNTNVDDALTAQQLEECIEEILMQDTELLETPITFGSPYGDRAGTIQANNADVYGMGECRVQESAYSSSGMAIICEEDETEFDTDIDNDTNYYTIA